MHLGGKFCCEKFAARMQKLSTEKYMRGIESKIFAAVRFVRIYGKNWEMQRHM